MILNKSQAEAVYAAMVALNNVSMRIDARVGNIHVYENTSGNVVVDAFAQRTEGYHSQSAFAAAYNITDE